MYHRCTRYKSILIGSATVLVLSLLLIAPVSAVTNVFINEIHYDNTGMDLGEGIEIAGPAGTDLTGWQIALYDGDGGGQYDVIPLAGFLPEVGNNFGVLTFSYYGLQDGSPDGVALVDGIGSVVQFLSYEGSFMAMNGVAAGVVSEDIGVFEPDNTAVGNSLQLTGTGLYYEDFIWTGPIANTFDAFNIVQTFANIGTCPGAIPIESVQGNGDFSPYVGQTVTVSGVVTADFGAELVVQDGLSVPYGGIVVYNYMNTADVGDTVCVSGSVVEYNGQTQIGGSGYTNAFIAVLSSSSTLPPPALISSGEVAAGAPTAEQWEGVLVRVEDASVTNADLGFGEFAVDDGSGTTRVDNKGLFSYTPAVGDILNYVQGPLFYTLDSYKIEPRTDKDISVREDDDTGEGCTDVVAPTAELYTSVEELWPANHKYVTVEVGAIVTDDSDPDPTIELVYVVSNEPDDGTGDGDTADDIVILDDFTFDLRAERSGSGDGRVYTIIYKAADDCGNETIATAEIVVPHDQKSLVDTGVQSQNQNQDQEDEDLGGGTGGGDDDINDNSNGDGGDDQNTGSNDDDGSDDQNTGNNDGGGSDDNAGNNDGNEDDGDDDAVDGSGEEGPQEFVCDQTPPALRITASMDALWPANHQYETVEVEVSARDTVDPDPVIEFVSAVSSEPDANQGGGDKKNDIVVVDDFTFQLRAERGKKVDLRVYWITYSATDSCGNQTIDSIEILVPRDKPDR